jgi:Domain of unknown function (DUF4468) with TBP-like fold
LHNALKKMKLIDRDIIQQLKQGATYLFLTCVSFCLALNGFAQNEDYDDYGTDNSNYNYDEYEPDSSYDNNYESEDDEGDSYSNFSDYFGGSNTSSEPTPKKIIRKPYVRFIPPYDSTRELIIYQAVIEVFDKEGYEVEIDTVYGRAQAWLQGEFGKELKKVISMNDLNENSSEMEYKIKVQADFPCVIKPNEFTEYQNGVVKYDMEIRVRDGRYRYAIKNLVHIAEPRAGEKEGVKTYFEYLMKTEDDVRNGDEVLIAADIKITAMMDALKRACHTAPEEEEDDW